MTTLNLILGNVIWEENVINTEISGMTVLKYGLIYDLCKRVPLMVLLLNYL